MTVSLKARWKTCPDCGANLGRNTKRGHRCQHCSSRHTAKQRFPKTYWMPNELAILKTYYSSMPNKEIQKLIPRHTKKGIDHKAWGLGYTKRGVKA